jgi:hypothetical protein
VKASERRAITSSVRDRLTRCHVDPMFPSQVAVEADGTTVWCHHAAQLYAYLRGADCGCMTGSIYTCPLHSPEEDW